VNFKLVFHALLNQRNGLSATSIEKFSGFVWAMWLACTREKKGVEINMITLLSRFDAHTFKCTFYNLIADVAVFFTETFS